MKLHFLGANRQVTGSRYLLEAAGMRILVDCGLFQERCCLERNWKPCPVDAKSIDCLLLTHAHLDHCGLIPKLVLEGFDKTIYTTAPSIDLAKLVLEDTAEIQEEDAKYKKKRHEREGRKGPFEELPLYTKMDAQNAFKHFRIVSYDTPIKLNDSIDVKWVDAGHILGSSMLHITVREGERTKRLVFSGDIGAWDRPLMHNPTVFDEADYVVMESTYGDRDSEPPAQVPERLAQVINDTVERRGNILIPTFAIDRAQEMMYYIGNLVRENKIPRLTVFLDSPMALDATTIYKRFDQQLDEDTQAILERGDHPFQFAGMHFVRTQRESQSINSIRGSCIIMAGSGMCTGGRIKHHLRHNIENPEATLLFVGYQAKDTLGRHILNGEQTVRIHGRNYTVRAKIERLYGLSAHSDRSGLLRWVNGFKKPPAHAYITHGDEEAALALQKTLEQQHGWTVTVPEYLDEATLT